MGILHTLREALLPGRSEKKWKKIKHLERSRDVQKPKVTKSLCTNSTGINCDLVGISVINFYLHSHACIVMGVGNRSTGTA